MWRCYYDAAQLFLRGAAAAAALCWAHVAGLGDVEQARLGSLACPSQPGVWHCTNHPPSVLRCATLCARYVYVHGDYAGRVSGAVFNIDDPSNPRKLELAVGGGGSGARIGGCSAA